MYVRNRIDGLGSVMMNRPITMSGVESTYARSLVRFHHSAEVYTCERLYLLLLFGVLRFALASAAGFHLPTLARVEYMISLRANHSGE